MMVSKDHSVIDEIHTALTTFVSTNPVEWAVLISKWCFELLGISSLYFVEFKKHVDIDLFK